MITSSHFIFGLHAVEGLLKKHPRRISRLLILQDRQDKKMESILQIAKQQGIPTDYTSRVELDHLTGEANHQGILAFCTKAESLSESDLQDYLNELKTPPFILLLDGIQDPHNLGACFRTADAAGVHVIIAPKDKAVGMTPTVSKVASGAAEMVPFIQVTNLVRTMENLKQAGIWMYGAAAEAEKTIYETDLKGPLAFVLGAEGAGLRRLTREHCDGLVNIPMQGSVSSLNVSVATGILLFEAVRQRSR